LDTLGAGQESLELVQARGQQARTLAPAQEQDVGVDPRECWRAPGRLRDDAEVADEGGSEDAHRRMVAGRSGVTVDEPADEHLQQPARHEIEDRRPHLAALHACDERGRDVAGGDLALQPRQQAVGPGRIREQRRLEDRSSPSFSATRTPPTFPIGAAGA